jgi:hypothetical protein
MNDMGGLAVASVLALCLWYVAYVTTWRLCPRVDTLTRWAAALVVVAATCSAIFHLLAWWHLFTRGPVTLVTLLTVAAAWSLAGDRGRLVTRVHRDRRFAGRVARRVRTSPYRFVAAGLIACTLPAIARAVVMPPLGWDALTYHAVKSAMWVQHGGGRVLEGPGPWAYYRNMSAGAEVLQAWTMLPLSSDAFTTMLDVVGWMAVGLGVIALARWSGVREPLASAAAGFVLTIPCLRLMIGSGYSEPFQLSTFVIGLALLLAAEREPRALVLAGVALGLSAGAKASMLPVTGVALLVGVAWFAGRQRYRRLVIASVAAYSAGVLPWMIASVVDTGRPLSPFDLHMGPLALGVVPPEVAWYVDRPLPARFDWHIEFTILKNAFAWPAKLVDGVGILGVVPLVGMVLGFAAFARRQRDSALLLCATALACIGFYYSAGFAPVRHTFPQNSARFLLPLLIGATVIWVGACRRGSIAARLTWLLLMACAVWNGVGFAFTGFSPVSKRASAQVIVMAVVVACVWYLLRWVTLTSARRAARAAVVAAALIATLNLRDTLRDPLLHSDYGLHWFAGWRYWAQAVSLVDHPGEHYRISVTSGSVQNTDNWFVYLFMGRRLQNEVVYVPVSGDGRLDHFGRDEEYERLARRANYWAWRLRLHNQGVTHVLSFEPSSLEIGWMLDHPESFERMTGRTGNWGLFRVKHDLPSPSLADSPSPHDGT